jgi:hypothetical protein
MSAKAIAGALLIEMILFCGCVSAQTRQDVAVVVNADNPINLLSSAELRKIFMGEKRSWPGGSPIKLVVRAPGTHERLVLMKLLRMSAGDYKQHWVAQIVRGDASGEPIVVPSVGMQREAIITFRSAITFVDANDLKPGMKVLKIDGHLPGEAEYPLY